MIKFIRQIRRRLLLNGKLYSYFTYAVGEVLLIMIDVLLALQVNNWNENHKSLADEKVEFFYQENIQLTKRAGMEFKE